MDISKQFKTIKGSPSSVVSGNFHLDVPIEVQVVSDIGDMGDVEQMSTTSSDSDIGKAESCSPNEFSKPVFCHSHAIGNGNGDDLQTKAEAKAEADMAMFNGFEDEADFETPLVEEKMSRSPSIQGNVSSGDASVSDLDSHDGLVSKHGDVVIGPNIDRNIIKEYSPSMNRIRNDLNMLQQLPINENPWEFFERNATGSGIARSATAAAARIQRPNPVYSVGIQVNNPEYGNFVHRNTECDWIRCMMCAVIVACIITGLCAATVMILNTFFQYWLQP